MSHYVGGGYDSEGKLIGDGTVDALDSGYVLARCGCSVCTGDPPWLTPEQWQQVGKLMPQLEERKKRLSSRIVRAISYHGKASLERYLEVRWILLAAGIEALVGSSVETGGRGKQFKSGLNKLAQCSDSTLAKNDVANTWHNRRCPVAHCQDLPPACSKDGEPNDELYERVFGTSLCNILADPTFSNHFIDDASVALWLATSR